MSPDRTTLMVNKHPEKIGLVFMRTFHIHSANALSNTDHGLRKLFMEILTNFKKALPNVGV